MPTHPKLTESILKRATVAEGAEETHWDGEMRGLGVRVRRFGGQVSKTWTIKYRNAAGAQRKLSLGTFPGVSVKDARKQARKELGRIADKADPVRELKRQRDAGTVAGLLSRFLKDHVKGKGRAKTTADEYERLIEKVIKPGLGQAAVHAVERDDVERWFSKLSDTPRQANQALAVLSKAMNLAEGWKLRPASSNPCRGIERYPENQRDRHPSAEEYTAIGKALTELESKGTVSEKVGNVIRVLALTGFRLSEVRSLRWRNVDTKSGKVALERVKSGKIESKARMVGTATLAILAGQERGEDDEYVFSGQSADEPVSMWTVEKSWARVREKAKIEGLRLHDLRHGVGTIAATLGANAFLVRDKLGHATLQMTSRYVGKQTDPLKEISEKIETQVAAAMGGKKPGNVRSIAKR
jgi:integrase